MFRFFLRSNPEALGDRQGRRRGCKTMAPTRGSWAWIVLAILALLCLGNSPSLANAACTNTVSGKTFVQCQELRSLGASFAWTLINATNTINFAFTGTNFQQHSLLFATHSHISDRSSLSCSSVTLWLMKFNLKDDWPWKQDFLGVELGIPAGQTRR